MKYDLTAVALSGDCGPSLAGTSARFKCGTCHVRSSLASESAEYVQLEATGGTVNSTGTVTNNRGRSSLHPVVAGTAGMLTFGLAMAVGEIYGLNSDQVSTANSVIGWIADAAIAVVGLAITLWLGKRAWSGSTTRLSRTALGLSLASAATYLAFWSGWPNIFSAAAIGLALEHRRRDNSWSVATGLAVGLGILVFVATAITCVLG